MNNTFPQGNFESWTFFALTYFPKMKATIDLIDTTVSAALSALVGEGEYEGDVANLDFRSRSNNQVPEQVKVLLSYNVPSFGLSYASEEAVEHDESVILSYLLQLDKVKWEAGSVVIDTKKGIASIQFDLSLSGV